MVMKKKFNCLFVIMLSLIVLSGCSSDDELKNPLEATLWSFDDEIVVFEKHEFTRYIEFVDEQTVKVWDTNNGTVYTGTYQVSGNSIIFHNLTDAYWDWHYIGGTFSSNSVTISYSYDKEHVTGPYYQTYTKE